MEPAPIGQSAGLLTLGSMTVAYRSSGRFRRATMRSREPPEPTQINTRACTNWESSKELPTTGTPPQVVSRDSESSSSTPTTRWDRLSRRLAITSRARPLAPIRTISSMAVTLPPPLGSSRSHDPGRHPRAGDRAAKSGCGQPGAPSPTGRRFRRPDRGRPAGGART